MDAVTRRAALVAAAGLPAGCATLPVQETASTESSEQQSNIAAIRAAIEDRNRNDVPAYVARHSEDFANFGRVIGRARLAEIVRDIITTFPDGRYTIEEIVASRDQVVTRSTFSATHLGIGRLPVNGGMLVGVGPTGRSFSIQHMHWYTLREGLIVAHTACRDDIGMMVQLGLLTRPTP
jgi:predicted ester cyclase